MMKPSRLFCDPNRMREKYPAPVGIISGPHLYPGQFSNYRGFDGVLKQDGQIESFF
jgi:hypothetical protein